MKSERPENDEDAGAGDAGQPPEAAQETPESPEADGATAHPTGDAEPEPAEDAESAETEPAQDAEVKPGQDAEAETPVPDEPSEPAEPLEPAAPAAPAAAADVPETADVPAAAGVPAAADVAEAAASAQVVDVSEAAGDSGEPEGERGGRRRSSGLVVVSVAAAVLLVGGGGAYLVSGGSGAGAGSSAGATPPPLALDGHSSGGNGIAPGEPDPYGVTYRASGTLPGGPGSAAVYQPSGAVSKDRVAALAKALGITGAPVAEGQVWKVGTDHDGSGGSLQVNRAAPGIWTYSHYAPGTDDCASTVTCVKDPAAPADEPVGEAAARKAAAPVLKALGEDDAKLDTSQVMGAQRVVNADPVVGGLPTYGWTTGLTVGARGELVGGNGMLATPAKGDTYPVLGAARTLALMNAAPGTGHRMGIGGCTSSVPQKDRLEQPCAASTPSAARSAAPAVVEKAVFGLAAQSVAGRQALVPSWLFQVRGSGSADAYTVSYPAVDPKYLASASTPAAPSGSASAAPKDVKVDGYTTDDRELVVAFTGGVCADYKVTADEGSEQVVVKVTATPWPDKVCVMIAKQYHQAVRLDAPLDGRKVVGTDGRAVPKERAAALNPQVG
ncbi:hypothetical protein [Streptomyces arenae]|uniref:hypothetical protein n=1 Tax=Streptomyces arenae TaxID=29301 RepID=UPI00265B1ED6|nr:hypothetical protein [Streptomyces arenae]MCG7204507.1 hypothetical protein [Streptomyces arenae]